MIRTLQSVLLLMLFEAFFSNAAIAATLQADSQPWVNLDYGYYSPAALFQPPFFRVEKIAIQAVVQTNTRDLLGVKVLSGDLPTGSIQQIRMNDAQPNIKVGASYNMQLSKTLETPLAMWMIDSYSEETNVNKSPLRSPPSSTVASGTDISKKCYFTVSIQAQVANLVKNIMSCPPCPANMMCAPCASDVATAKVVVTGGDLPIGTNLSLSVPLTTTFVTGKSYTINLHKDTCEKVNSYYLNAYQLK